MHLFRWFLIAAAMVSAGIAAWARAQKRQSLLYLFKPLTMALILVLALGLPFDAGSWYAKGILLGLLISLAGDMALILPKDRFVLGLGFFLMALLFYTAAFASGGRFRICGVWAIPFAVWGYFVFRTLSAHLGRMRIPVVFYTVVMLTMVWQAWERADRIDTLHAWLAALGAALFLFSDSVLALDRFRQRIPNGQAVILGTYYAGQIFIALSTGRWF
jgi:uncharacterized membrane protein YhhN